MRKFSTLSENLNEKRFRKVILFFILTLLFTVGLFQSISYAQAPGGVTEGLSLWVKGNGSKTLSGTNVTAWNDLSGNGNDLTNTSANYPQFVDSVPELNFNATLRFNKSWIRNMTTQVLPANSSASVFSIVNPSQLVSYNSVWRFATNDPGLNIYANRWTLIHSGNSAVSIQPPQVGKTQLVSVLWTHNVSPSLVQINGQNFQAAKSINTNGNNYWIGAGNATPSDPFYGDIAENIVYSRVLSGEELIKVNSYLALKYGLTLDENPADATLSYDYISSDGTVFWSQNPTFKYNIFGIGRDDASELLQKKSKSANAGSVITLEVEDINEDQSFFMVGDNNGNTKYTVKYKPNSFNVDSIYYALQKVWYVKETGSIQGVWINLEGIKATHLLVHNSPDFTVGTPIEIPIIDGKVKIDFKNGQYFTFAAPRVAPGGVSEGLSLWVKGDGEMEFRGTKVSTWKDQSGNERHLGVASTAYFPQFVDSVPALNFNPTLRFDNNYLRTSTQVIPANSSASVFSVVNPKRFFANSTHGVWEFATNDPGLNVYQNKWVLYHGGNGNVSIAPPQVGLTQLVNMHWTHNGNGIIEINGQVNYPGRTVNTNGNNYYLGAGTATAGEPWLGDIAENIVYDRQLTGVELAKVNSYLALKYGITLNEDPASATLSYNYISSDGTVFWPKNPAFKYSIFGVGRDDESKLLQKKSKSANPGSVLILEVDSIDTDQSFFMVGDNNAPPIFSVKYTPKTFTSDSSYYALEKVWYVKETGSIKGIWLSLEGINATHLLVHNSPDFTTGTPIEIPIHNGRFNNDFLSGQYFTFAAPGVGPGGVHTNLSLWLKADDGPNTNVTGELVNTWLDASGKSNHHTNVYEDNLPSYVGEGGKNLMNFYPSVNFNSGSKLKYLRADDFIDQKSSVSIYTVSRIASTTGIKTIYSFTVDSLMVGWSADKPYFKVNNVATSIVTPLYQYGIFGLHLHKKETGFKVHWNGELKTASKQTYTLSPSYHSAYFLGMDRGSKNAFNGDIQEVIIYSDTSGFEMPTEQATRVMSYLALKYGIPMHTSNFPNYYSSNGTEIWTGSKNTGYQNNILGLGKDVGSSLLQKQAFNYADSTLIVYLGELKPLNNQNTSIIEKNNSFILFGNNGASGMKSIFYNKGEQFQNGILPSMISDRYSKMWKAQATTTTSWTVNIKTHGFAVGEYIIVSSDTSFVPARSRFYPIVEGHAINVVVNDGDYICIASLKYAPGGVSQGLSVWLHPDKGVVEGKVATWGDISGNGRDFTQTVEANQPVKILGSRETNYNSALYFNNAFLSRVQDMYSTNVGDYIGMFTAVRLSELSSIQTVIGMTTGTYLQYSNTRWNFNSSSPHPAMVDMKNTVLSTFITVKSTSTKINDVDGRRASYSTSASLTSAQLHLGKANATTPSYLNGHLYEFVVYSANLSNKDIDKLNSYFAIKYGTTLKNPNNFQYVASDGTIIWNGKLDSMYNSNIAGLGRDDISYLYQKQAVSTNPGFQIIMSVGDLAENNNENPNQISQNLSYLVWGDNSIDNNLVNRLQYSSSVDMYLSQRKWKVTNTRFKERVKIQFPIELKPGELSFDCESYKLIISNSLSFTSSSITHIEDVEITEDGIFANFEFPEGVSFFTLARVNQVSKGKAYLPKQEIRSNFYYDCSDEEWKYFYESFKAEWKLMAFSNFTNEQLNNFEIHLSPSGVSYGEGTKATKIMPRVISVLDKSKGTNYNGKVRVYFDPTELESMKVPNSKTNAWFKYSGNVTDALEDVLDDGKFYSGTAMILEPALFGKEDGVDYVEFHNVAGFSSFGFVSSTMNLHELLPVAMSSLSAKKVDNVVELTWSTYSESQNSHFEVQRANAKGQWKTIGSVYSKASQGNSGVKLDYSFFDKDPNNGVNTYRLKQVDLDGKFNYSTQVVINFNATVLINFHPNPVIKTTTITGLKEKDKIQIYNSNGNVMKTLHAKGEQMDVDMSEYKTGIYFVRVNRDGISNTFKILKLN